MKPALVLVTEAEFQKGRDVFEAASGEQAVFRSAPEDEAGLAEACAAEQVRAVIVGVRRYESALYSSLPAGGLIARFGVGHDGVDKRLAAARGLLVSNTPGVLDTSVAEHAIGLVCALARGMSALSEGVRAGRWEPKRGVELRGKTLALIGFGRIAREAASIAARGFGMDIIACDVTPPEAHRDFLNDLSEQAGVRTEFTGDIGEALSRGRFASLHLPLLDSTRGLIGPERIARMGADAYLVNTSRGGIVDEGALYDALATDRLAGAAFDVFESEPYTPAAAGKDLRTLPNMVMTPHVSSNTDMSNRRMAERCVANVTALLDGRTEDMDLVSA